MFPTGLPHHILNVKIGSVVILLVNIDTSQGLCNGARLIIRSINNHVLDVEVLSGPQRGYRCLLNRFKMQERENNAGFRVQRIQFPVRLAYAITIHKAQGQTYDRVGLDLKQPVFAHGMFYVAISRVRSFDSLKIRVANILDLQGVRTINGLTGTYTKNKVYAALTLLRKFLLSLLFR